MTPPGGPTSRASSISSFQSKKRDRSPESSLPDVTIGRSQPPRKQQALTQPPTRREAINSVLKRFVSSEVGVRNTILEYAQTDTHATRFDKATPLGTRQLPPGHPLIFRDSSKGVFREAIFLRRSPREGAPCIDILARTPYPMKNGEPVRTGSDRKTGPWYEAPWFHHHCTDLYDGWSVLPAVPVDGFAFEALPGFLHSSQSETHLTTLEELIEHSGKLIFDFSGHGSSMAWQLVNVLDANNSRVKLAARDMFTGFVMEILTDCRYIVLDPRTREGALWSPSSFPAWRPGWQQPQVPQPPMLLGFVSPDDPTALCDGDPVKDPDNVWPSLCSAALAVELIDRYVLGNVTRIAEARAGELIKSDPVTYPGATRARLATQIELLCLDRLAAYVLIQRLLGSEGIREILQGWDRCNSEVVENVVSELTNKPPSDMLFRHFRDYFKTRLTMQLKKCKPPQALKSLKEALDVLLTRPPQFPDPKLVTAHAGEETVSTEGVEPPEPPTLSARQARELWSAVKTCWHVTSQDDEQTLSVLLRTAPVSDSKSRPTGDLDSAPTVESVLTGLTRKEAETALVKANTQLFLDAEPEDGPNVSRYLAQRHFRLLEEVWDRLDVDHVKRFRAVLELPEPRPSEEFLHSDIRFLMLNQPSHVIQSLVESLEHEALSRVVEQTDLTARQRIARDWRELGLELRGVRGDGNCLFSALMQSLWDVQRSPTSGSKDTKSALVPGAMDPGSAAHSRYVHFAAQQLRASLASFVGQLSDDVIRTLSPSSTRSSVGSFAAIRERSQALLLGGLHGFTAPQQTESVRSYDMAQIAKATERMENSVKEQLETTRATLDRSLYKSEHTTDWWGTALEVALFARFNKQPVVCLSADGPDGVRALYDEDGQHTTYPDVASLRSAIDERARTSDKKPIYLVNRHGNHFEWAVRRPRTGPGRASRARAAQPTHDV
jgi:hypothetical protein